MRLRFRGLPYVGFLFVVEMTDTCNRYGDEKPASEMLFSYGFLETNRTEAREILLNFDIPEDDPLALPKKVFCQNDTGIRIMATQSLEGKREVTWKSAFTWLACVNEEDGLQFELAQTIDGGREMETSWKGKMVESPSHLLELLAIDPLWKIFQLRATVLLLERLETQLALFQETEKVISNLREDQMTFQSLFRPGILEPISLFRKLEVGLLEKAIEGLIQNVSDLISLAFRAVPVFVINRDNRRWSCWHLRLLLPISSRKRETAMK